MSKRTDRTDKCGASQRCRQPVVFTVDAGSWRSLVCERHLGVLAHRRLSLDSTGDPLRVAEVSR